MKPVYIIGEIGQNHNGSVDIAKLIVELISRPVREEVFGLDLKGMDAMNFWASWCGPCKSEMPDFEEAYKEYGDQIHFLMINLTDGSQETQEGAAAFIAEQGYTFPVFYDMTYNAAGQYVSSGIPITYFIDAEGNFVAYGQGALNAETLQTGIDMLFE